MNKVVPIKKYNVMIAHLPDCVGASIQTGTRPCIIVSNNLANKHSPVIHVAPFTLQKKKPLPTHVPITLPDGSECVILLEQTMPVNRNSIDQRRIITNVAEPILRNEINKAIKIHFSL